MHDQDQLKSVRTRVREIAAAAILVGGAVVASVVAVEIGLRLTGYAELSITDPLFRQSASPGVVYEFRPNATGYCWGRTRTQINGSGLRGPEITLDKAKGAIRIGVFGDSATFGQGVDEDSTYARVLERRLREVSGATAPSIEVLNFGVPAYNIGNMVSTFTEKGVRFDLDVAILAPIPEDYGFHREHAADAYGYPIHAGTPVKPGPLKNFLRHVHLAYVARDAWLRLRGYGVKEQEVLQDPSADPELAARTLDRAARETERFAEVARQRGIVAIYLNLGSRTPPEIEKDVERAGFTVMNVQPALDGIDPSTLVVSARDNHPSALYHGIIAGELLEPLSAILRERVKGSEG